MKLVIFLGGTNDGRGDGGMPPPNARHWAMPTLSGSGQRMFRSEIYYRCGVVWRHESLETPGSVMAAIYRHRDKIAKALKRQRVWQDRQLLRRCPPASEGAN